MKTRSSLALLVAALLGTAGVVRASTAAENWDNQCAKCHAADGSGNTRIGKKLHVKDYTDAKVQAGLKDDDLFAGIKNGVTVDGKERMKAFKDDLSDPEIKDLVAYIRKLAPAK